MWHSVGYSPLCQPIKAKHHLSSAAYLVHYSFNCLFMSSNYNHGWHKALALHIQIPKSDKAIMAEMAQARQTRPSLISLWSQSINNLHIFSPSIFNTSQLKGSSLRLSQVWCLMLWNVPQTAIAQSPEALGAQRVCLCVCTRECVCVCIVLLKACTNVCILGYLPYWV